MVDRRRIMRRLLRVWIGYAALLLSATASLFGADTGWPVNGGPYNIRYTELSQITPVNVARLQVAWTWDGHEAFKDSEMQSNPSWWTECFTRPRRRCTRSRWMRA